MTYYTHTRINPARRRKLSLFGALLRANQAYRDRRHLLSLTDEQLDDVGLTRSDLRNV